MWSLLVSNLTKSSYRKATWKGRECLFRSIYFPRGRKCYNLILLFLLTPILFSKYSLKIFCKNIAAAVLGVEVEQSFNFGCAAIRPQFGRKRLGQWSFYFEIATSKKERERKTKIFSKLNEITWLNNSLACFFLLKLRKVFVQKMTGKIGLLKLIPYFLFSHCDWDEKSIKYGWKRKSYLLPSLFRLILVKMKGNNHNGRKANYSIQESKVVWSRKWLNGQCHNPGWIQFRHDKIQDSMMERNFFRWDSHV